jgi:hypothetical protein
MFGFHSSESSRHSLQSTTYLFPTSAIQFEPDAPWLGGLIRCKKSETWQSISLNQIHISIFSDLSLHHCSYSFFVFFRASGLVNDISKTSSRGKRKGLTRVKDWPHCGYALRVVLRMSVLNTIKWRRIDKQCRIRPGMSESSPHMSIHIMVPGWMTLRILANMIFFGFLSLSLFRWMRSWIMLFRRLRRRALCLSLFRWPWSWIMLSRRWWRAICLSLFRVWCLLRFSRRRWSLGWYRCMDSPAALAVWLWAKREII